MVKSGKYEHYKGNEYTVKGIVFDGLEEYVLYVDGENKHWMRPKEMFKEYVEVVSGVIRERFKYASSTPNALYEGKARHTETLEYLDIGVKEDGRMFVKRQV